ncbi:MAG TPA: peptidase M61, partial [Balneolaceae bacterium]|nr:peptidase M61 [Balneolaceae bacterium]
KPLDEPLAETSIGTISHEFVHTWNVERIRPASLEPFNFEEANMSGELWFAEGFTSYYTGLILARAGVRTEQE